MTPEERHVIAKRIQDALNRLDAAIREHKPTHVFGLFSGGHDSFSASYVASFHPKVEAFAHINTGIGIEATRQYVIDTCEARSWKLIELKAAENVNAKGEPDPQKYSDIVRRYGFPGPASHGMMYTRLKERALRRLEREVGASCRGKEKRRVMYVSGCRVQESTRRMGNVDEVQIDGRRIWVAPIWDWSKLDTSLCLEYAKQPRNLVVDLIHKSGECLCGAFAKPGELEELNAWDVTKDAYNHIKRLETEVVPCFGTGWGERPRKKSAQVALPGMLCWSCTK